MLALKRIVTVAVMVYLLLSLLFILSPAVRSSIMGLGDGLSNLAQERQFFYTMFVIGAVILALHLLTENMDSAMLRRNVSQHEGKINELKAKLYDLQQRTGQPLGTNPIRETGTTTYPPHDPNWPSPTPPPAERPV
ncbi:hypothetical protein GCM10023185_35290 [Hymenobacter saemangeumensis]|uniref:LapA family protein n=1 Tax=Hymenobacter saemangeumensis TaxID=1084522 RepID=A0ABP8IPE3_9BACT